MTTSYRDSLSLASAALAIGSTTSQIATGKAVDFTINGRAYSKAATATAALGLVSAAVALAANQVCALFICLDSAGVVSTIQSAVKPAATNAAGYAAGAFEWPNPADKAVIGAVLVKSGGSAFTPGTTAFTGVATYINVALDYGVPIVY